MGDGGGGTLVQVMFTAGGVPLTTLPGESLLYVGYVYFPVVFRSSEGDGAGKVESLLG